METKNYVIGLDANTDAPNRLLLDIDRKRCPQYRRITRELRRAGLIPRAISFERTRHGWHIIIVLNRILSNFARCALQAALGSDRWRELSNFRSILYAPRHAPKNWNWNVFYERKIT